MKCWCLYGLPGVFRDLLSCDLFAYSPSLIHILCHGVFIMILNQFTIIHSSQTV